MENYDVLIVGGSHAGLSAGMALGRLQRSVIIVDAGDPRNVVSDHANNIAGLDGKSPNTLRADARKDLEKYEIINFQEDFVVTIKKKDDLFEASLKSGGHISVRKVILAYGVRDILPEIEGIGHYWGGAVFHCPFCHGHEFKGKTIGLVGNSHYLEHMIPMMLNLTANLVLFPQGKLELEPFLNEKVNNRGIGVYESKIKNIVGPRDLLESLFLEDGTSVSVNALLVSLGPPVELKSTLGEKLGCEKDENGFLKVDFTGKTTVDGVFAAGDITTGFQSVVQALASGQKAGAAAVMELSQEDVKNG